MSGNQQSMHGLWMILQFVGFGQICRVNNMQKTVNFKAGGMLGRCRSAASPSRLYPGNAFQYYGAVQTSGCFTFSG